MSTPPSPRRAVLLGLLGASGLAVTLGVALLGSLPASAQVTPPTEASTTTSTEPPSTTTTTEPPSTTTTTRPRTTTTTRPRTTTTTRPPTTTTTEAPTTTSSSTSSTTSTTAAPAALAPPGFTSPDGDSGGGGGGWSTDTKIAVVVGGLLVVAAGLAGLAFAYWRGTRPAVGAAAELPGEDEAEETAAGVPAVPAQELVTAGALAGAAESGARDDPTGPIEPVIIGDDVPAPPAPTPAAEVDPLILLLAGEDAVGPAGGAGSGAAPVDPTGPVAVGPVGYTAPEPPPTPPPAPAPVEEGPPTEAVPPVAAQAPAQSSGVRIIGPLEPGNPLITRDDLGLNEEPDDAAAG